MRKEITACRVCGDPKLVAYMGLCEQHHNETIRFWARLKDNLKVRKEKDMMRL